MLHFSQSDKVKTFSVGQAGNVYVGYSEEANKKLSDEKDIKLISVVHYQNSGVKTDFYCGVFVDNSVFQKYNGIAHILIDPAPGTSDRVLLDVRKKFMTCSQGYLRQHFSSMNPVYTNPDSFITPSDVLKKSILKSGIKV